MQLFCWLTSWRESKTRERHAIADYVLEFIYSWADGDRLLYVLLLKIARYASAVGARMVAQAFRASIPRFAVIIKYLIY